MRRLPIRPATPKLKRPRGPLPFWRRRSTSPRAAIANRERAATLLEQHGRTSDDYFKLWPDKRYFFNGAGSGFVAYGVAYGVALALGDPVAPDAEMAQTIREFMHHCRRRGLAAVFYEATGDFLDIYSGLDYRKIKMGDDAIVDLTTFTLAGGENKSRRNHVNRLDKRGMTAELHMPPTPHTVIAQARAVSDEWLTLGRRERTFSVGRFEDLYIRRTPLFAVYDERGLMQAFANIIPSYAPQTATIDLMRRRAEPPPNAIDYLFAKLFLLMQAQGYTRFSLGQAPLTPVAAGEEMTFEERTVHRLSRWLEGFFSVSGLRDFKAKYATIWEPRYLFYRNSVNLPQIALAIMYLAELDENRRPLWSRERRAHFRALSSEILANLKAPQAKPPKTEAEKGAEEL